MNKIIHILGIPGSIRRGSYNRIVLQDAQSVVPDTAEIEIFEQLASIPVFNQDEEDHPPASVLELKNKIHHADAILFATPEYNYSIPGVLKNAIDWASRPYGKNAWEGKPVGIMSASTSMLGGARAQYHLRQVFVFLNMHPLNKPEVIIPQIQEKVNAEGKIIDEHTKEKIKEMVFALLKWTIELETGQKSEEIQETHPYERAYNRMIS